MRFQRYVRTGVGMGCYQPDLKNSRLVRRCLPGLSSQGPGQFEEPDGIAVHNSCVFEGDSI